MKNSLFKKELMAILKSKKLLIPIIAVLFIPVLYSGMFLWAFWDPYDQLSDLPVAVVDNDMGAKFEDKSLTLGRDLVDKLKESHDFNFIFVDQEEGLKGLQNQKYYMMIEIPENFSENATTLIDDQPKKLELIYKPNESYNFLSSQIGSTAIEKIKASLSAKISETYAETIFSKMDDLSNGLVDASDGALELSDGANKLETGATDLQKGLATLAEKSIEFNEGVSQIDIGTSQLKTGAGKLANGLGLLDENYQKLEAASGQLVAGSTVLQEGFSTAVAGIHQLQSKAPELVSGTEKLESGAKQLNSSVKEWQKGAEATADGAAKVKAGLIALSPQIELVLSNNPDLPAEQKAVLQKTLQQLVAGSQQVALGTSELSEGAKIIESGSNALASNLSAIKDGENRLLGGINQLATGATELDQGLMNFVSGQQQFQDGMHLFGTKMTEAKNASLALASGSTELASGLDKLSSGSNALTEGVAIVKDGSDQLSVGQTQLSHGANELATGLSDGKEKLSQFHPTKKTSNMIGDPVVIKNDKINEVPNYGTGFTPYFLSLGLFVGALLISIVFPLKEPVDVPKNGFSWFIGKFGVLVLVGVVQALVASGLLLVGLGLQVESVPFFILFAVVTSLTFLALIQLLVTTMGDPGRFLAIVILILQLTTSAGTFPLELIPNALQPINALLPMTYSVMGFKAVISSGDFSFMWHNALILIGYLAVFMILTLTFLQFKHKRQFEVFASAK
ncbi:YhgE/Pip family protein [Pseudoneobacillus sp. C159]